MPQHASCARLAPTTMLTFACPFRVTGVKDSKKAKELRKAEQTKKMFGSVPFPVCPRLLPYVISAD